MEGVERATSWFTLCRLRGIHWASDGSCDRKYLVLQAWPLGVSSGGFNCGGLKGWLVPTCVICQGSLPLLQR